MATGTVRPSWATCAAAVARARLRARPFLIPLALAAAAASLALGLTLPIMRASRFFMFTRPVSIVDGVQILLGEGDWALATIIVVFSVVFPLLKIAVTAALWLRLRRNAPVPLRLSSALDALGKWSMLDVFVVALVIFWLKTGAFSDATGAPALYPFVLAIVLTAFASHAVVREARRREALIAPTPMRP